MHRVLFLLRDFTDYHLSCLNSCLINDIYSESSAAKVQSFPAMQSPKQADRQSRYGFDGRSRPMFSQYWSADSLHVVSLPVKPASV